LPALNHKNPQVKEGTLKFLTRCLATSTQAIPPTQIKPVSEALATLLEDSAAGARDEAAVALGTLMKMVGERPLGPAMEGLADVRRVKVQEAFEKAVVKAKAGSGGPPRSGVLAAAPAAKAAPKAAPKKAPPPKKAEPTAPPPPPPVDDEPDGPPPPKKDPPARLLAKKSPVAGGAPPSAAAPPAVAAKKPSPGAAVAAAAASKSGKPPPPAAPGALDTFKYKHTPEDAEAHAAEIIPANFATDLADSNWKTRLAALEEMTTWVESNVEGLDAEVTFRFLGKRGWAEKNFQVCSVFFPGCVTLQTHCASGLSEALQYTRCPR
jgi:cytoskeleton-associated protein 5